MLSVKHLHFTLHLSRFYKDYFSRHSFTNFLSIYVPTYLYTLFTILIWRYILTNFAEFFNCTLWSSTHRLWGSYVILFEHPRASFHGKFEHLAPTVSNSQRKPCIYPQKFKQKCTTLKGDLILEDIFNLVQSSKKRTESQSNLRLVISLKSSEEIPSEINLSLTGRGKWPVLWLILVKTVKFVLFACNWRMNHTLLYF